MAKASPRARASRATETSCSAQQQAAAVAAAAAAAAISAVTAAAVSADAGLAAASAGGAAAVAPSSEGKPAKEEAPETGGAEGGEWRLARRQALRERRQATAMVPTVDDAGGR